MKKYGKFAALIVVVIGTLVWLATAGMKETQTYYKTVAELGQMGDEAYGKRIRVGGDVESGSNSARRQSGSLRPDPGQDAIEGCLHRLRAPAGHF